MSHRPRGMHLKLDCEAIAEKITFILGEEIATDYDRVGAPEIRTHTVIIEGRIEHPFMNKDPSRLKVGEDKNQPFSIEIQCPKEVCEFLQQLLSDELAKDIETFPQKPWN